MDVINQREGYTTMGQDKNAENEYRTGYGGYGRYTTPQQPGDTPGGPQYGQQGGQSGTQQGSQQQQGGSQQYQQSSYGQQFQQQEYKDSTYQPPSSAVPTMSAYGPTTTPLSARTEAILSYALWWLSGLVFFVIERKNRFVRFAAAQSFLALGGAFLLYVILRLITLIPVIGFLLSPVLSCLVFVVLVPSALLWLFLLVQSYRGVQVKLPVVGDL